MGLNFEFGKKKKTTEDMPLGVEKPEVVEKTPFDHFDLEIAKVNFVEFEKQLSEMRGKAENLKVSDDARLEVAMQMLVQCKTIVRRAEDAKNALPAFKVARQFKNGVDKFIRERLKKPIASLENIIKPKVNSYQSAQAELKRRIAQQEAEAEAIRVKEETERLQKEADEKHQKELEEAKALQEKLNKEADEAGVDRVEVTIPEKSEDVEPVIEPPAPIVEKTDKIKTEHGSARVEAIWICEIMDPEKVDRKYCTPNQRLLNKAVEGGAREITGCKIFEIFDTKVRLAHQEKQTSFTDDIKF